MKRTLFALLLALAMIVCFAAFTATAEETQEHVHCVCGGCAVGVQDHVCEDITWQPLPEGTTDFSKLPSGNYYLTDDVTVTAANKFAVGTELKLCLNGHNITSTNTRVFGNNPEGKFSFCDCSGKQNADGKWTWDGTVTAGEGSGAYGGVLYTHYKAVVNVYGGNYTSLSTKAINGAVFIVANDGGSGSSKPENAASLNIYNGNIYNGENVVVAGAGGVIGSFHGVHVSIHGGYIHDGTTQGGGGAIISVTGNLTITGGEIWGGTTTKKGTSGYSGGNITHSKGCLDGIMTISGGKIYGGSASYRGGNINSYATVNITGGEIYGGVSENQGGNIHVEGTLNISGGKIYDGVAGTNGGNISSIKTMVISGGEIWGGLASANPIVTTDSNGKYTVLSGDSNRFRGVGGNIYGAGADNNITISGGKIYGGLANGIGGGNLFSVTGPVKIEGGMLWGGIANADNSQAGTAELNYAYSTCGGSVYINQGVFTMTGGSIGIDAEGKPAGGTTLPAGSEGGNLYLYNTSTGTSITGGTIAYGNVLGLDEEGNPIYGVTSKGGNCVGMANAEIGGTAVIRDGYATSRGGNISLFNNSSCKITGGTISGGKALRGGNIVIAGSGTTAHHIKITGGVIKDGIATTEYGGNIAVETALTKNADGTVKQAAKILTITNTTISDGTAATKGGNIWCIGDLNIGEGTTITGGMTTSTTDSAYGGSIYASGITTITKATITGGKGSHGGNICQENGSLTITDSTISAGEANLAETTNGNGGNIQTRGTSTTTITGSTITGGIARRGGNIAAFAPMTIADTTISDGVSEYSAGNLFIYNAGHATLNAGTVITGGEILEGSSGAQICVSIDNNSATGGLTINDGVVVEEGKCPEGGNAGISMSKGHMVITGNPTIGSIHLFNNPMNVAACFAVDFTGLTTTSPIKLSVNYTGTIATATADVTACFDVVDGTMAYNAEAGTVEVTLAPVAITEFPTKLDLIHALGAREYTATGIEVITIENGNAYVIYNGEKYEPVNGVLVVPVEGETVTFTVGNASEEKNYTFTLKNEYPLGTEKNPITINDASELTSVTAAAGETTYYAINSMLNGMTLTIVANENTTVTVNGAELAADENGLIIVTLTGTPVNKLTVTNAGEEATEQVAALEWPLGSQQNPIVINGAAELTAVEAGKYYAISAMLNGNFIVIEEAAGAVTLNGTALTAEGGYFVAELTGAPMNMLTATAAAAAQITDKAPEIEQPIEKFEIDVARMILGNALQFQFGVDMAKIPDTTGYYAVIEKTWADGTVTTKTISASEWGTVDKYYAIVYQGMAAKEMADTFYVTIYNADGVAVSNAKQDSVRDYVARAYKSQNTVGKTMVVDMLNYGAAAQVYFTYNTEDLANNQLTDEQKASGTAETPAMENKVVKGENYTASRFILSSSIQVQVGFKGLTKDMYAVYTYVDYRGLSREYRVEGEDFVVVNGQLAGVELSKLVYADARCLVSITVYNADGTVYGTATDSIESCAFRGNGDLFVALMKFADSARAKLSA